MPEFKNQFTGGKMNKDLDERIIPKGEYRDAMNIQVTTSEGSDVGAAQNILGNVPGCVYNNTSENPITEGSYTVSSISDEKNDSLYWLVAGINNDDFDISTFTYITDPITGAVIQNSISFKDIIMRTNSDIGIAPSGCEPVFVDKWKFCTTVPSVNFSAPTDIITFDFNTSLYSSVQKGMYATGFGPNGVIRPNFQSTLVTNVGNITTIPVGYTSTVGSFLPPTTAATVSGLRLRTFDRKTLGPSSGGFGNYQFATSNLGQSTNLQGTTVPSPIGSFPLNSTGQIQFLFSSAGGASLPGSIIVGGTINTPFDPTNGWLVSSIRNANLIHSPYLGTGNSEPYWVITVDIPDQWNMTGFISQGTANGLTPSGASYTQIDYFDPLDLVCTASPIPQPSNIVDITSISEQWANEIFDILYDFDPKTLSITPTGAKLQIDNLIGAGNLWPTNSCIDPESVTDVANGFVAGTPITYVTQYSIVDCGPTATDPVNALNPHAALDFNNPGDTLSFKVIQGSGIEGVFLQNNVDLQNVETICFEGDRVLNFHRDRLITGINIVDDMLFWTDNFTEPKKINIPRSVAGTDPSGDIHTAIENAGTNLSRILNYVPIREEHITVIRKNPKNALSLEMSTGRDDSLNYSGVVNTSNSPIQSSIISSTNPSVVNDFSSLKIGDRVKFELISDIDGNTTFDLAWGLTNKAEFLLLKEFDNTTGIGVAPSVPLAGFTIRGRITDWSGANYSSLNGAVVVEIEVVNLIGDPEQPSSTVPFLSFAVDLENSSNIIFEDKLPRFSYRYKYADGEYSTFAPFSQVAFLPSTLNYEAKWGWNTGMTNHMSSVKLRGFIPPYNSPLGLDVVEVDILYKEDISPNVYVVQTISPVDIPQVVNSALGITSPLPWNTNEYEITSEAIKNLLPSNQLLRPYDNVPKKALAQDISGNRIIYGNYEQNYDLLVDGKKYKPSFKNYLEPWEAKTTSDNSPSRSIKSLRDYKLGVVFTDKYGRETPVLISESGGFKVEKVDSTSANRLVVGLEGDIPLEMAFFKFYIKETSSEYYNLAMDRWYNAEDGNIWLAFPSTDRNKVDLDTYLYFKKGAGQDSIENTKKYKILAIENEAPEFIKTRKIRIGTVAHNVNQPLVPGGSDVARIFGADGDELLNAPTVGGISFELDYTGGKFSGTSLSHMEDIREDIYIQFVSSSDNSSHYKLSEITSDRDEQSTNTNPQGIPTKYFLTLDTNLKDDINFIFDNPTAPNSIQEGVKLMFTKAVVENLPKFDGRFFAKIENDGRIRTQITSDSIGVNYVEKASKMVYVLDDDETLITRQSNAIVSIDTWGALNNFPGGGQLKNRVLDTPVADAVTTSDSYINGTSGFGGAHANPGGINFKYYAARQSYFGKIFKNGDETYPYWADGRANASLEYIAIGGPGATYPGTNDALPGVWFINRSTRKYTVSPTSQSLYWPPSHDMGGFNPPCLRFGSTYHPGCNNTSVHTPTSSVMTGIKNYTGTSVVNLAFGGFGSKQPEKPYFAGRIFRKNLSRESDGWGFPLDANYAAQPDENFFDIGGLNEVYNDIGTNNFVKRIESGFSFKWKEDPTETVYTVVSQTSYGHEVRFGREDDGQGREPGSTNLSAHGFDELLIGSRSSYHKNWRFNVEPSMENWDPSGTVGSYMINGLSLGEGIKKTLSASGAIGATTITVNDVSGLLIGMTINLVDNGIPRFATGTKITSINQATNQINLSAGAIISVNAGQSVHFGSIALVSEYIYGHTNTSDVKENYIYVDNILTVCNNGNTSKTFYSLEPGMMLDIYNIDGFAGTREPGDISTGRKNNFIIGKIHDEDPVLGFKIDLVGYHTPLHFDVSTKQPSLTLEFDSATYSSGFETGCRIRFRQVTMNGASNFTALNTSEEGLYSGVANDLSGGIGGVGYTMQMVELVEEYSDGGSLPPDPYVWETEPKETTELDVYYEISENNPSELNQNTITTAIPSGSIVTSLSDEGGFSLFPGSSLKTLNHSSISGQEIRISAPIWIGPGPSPAPVVQPLLVGSKLQITRPSGVSFSVEIAQIFPEPTNVNVATRFRLQPSLVNNNYFLNWHNCYSFGNGVESNRIKDTFNEPFINNGVKVSTTLDQEYKQEHRKYGLIYSGIYNSSSGVNNLNQFIQAEKITKDINPIYGSIQKLHSGWGQSGDLVALCEDRVLKILANKDALFNADGNTNVTATNRVLGTATPYSGEFGISTNPESFASEAYRAYFTDKVRGSVIRLSIDGLTAISDHGMKDWFRDHLKLTNRLIGSYDDRKDQYNITLKDIDKTVTFKENVRGWVSFKSFFPENANSCANEYYTYLDGNLWKHHVEVFHPTIPNLEINRNTFYKTPTSSNNFTPSSINVILNEAPGSIKTFHTLNYEGTQSKIDEFREYNTFVPGTNVVNKHYYNNEYYNLEDIKGWYVNNIITDLEEGAVPEFIKKEGKWFNYIRGKAGSIINNDALTSNIVAGFDNANFSFQGIARAGTISTDFLLGCTDPTKFGYNPLATNDDGSCKPIVNGCTDPNADAGYDPAANVDDGTCVYYGCMDVTATNYNPNATVEPVPSPCLYSILGCTDPLAFNYDPNANIDDGSCQAVLLGCTDPTASNYNPLANTSDGSCVSCVYGCMNIAACNYDPNATCDDGSCLTVGAGCTDSTACNYDPAATCDNGTCLYCGDQNNTVNYDGAISSCTSGCVYCFVPTVSPATYSSNDVTIQWTPPTTGGIVASIIEFEVILYPSCELCNGAPNGPALQIVNTSNTSHTFTITPGQFYSVTVKSVCPSTSLPGTTVFSPGVYVQSTGYSGVHIPVVVVPGCTDPAANNYDSNATQDDGSCTYTIPGCTNPLACNFDSLANFDDGSCILPDGCTDPTATNYDATAQCDDGSCTYPVYGCTDPLASNYNCASALYTTGGVYTAPTSPCSDGVTDDDGSCVLPSCIEGCMDTTNCNYDPLATCDNNNACAPVCGLASGYPLVAGSSAGSSYVLNADGASPNCTAGCLTCEDPTIINILSGVGGTGGTLRTVSISFQQPAGSANVTSYTVQLWNATSTSYGLPSNMNSGPVRTRTVPASSGTMVVAFGGPGDLTWQNTQQSLTPNSYYAITVYANCIETSPTIPGGSAAGKSFSSNAWTERDHAAPDISAHPYDVQPGTTTPATPTIAGARRKAIASHMNQNLWQDPDGVKTIP